MKDYIFETYLKRLEARVKDLKEYYSKLDKADSSDDIKRAFGDVNIELSYALASLISSLDIVQDAFNADSKEFKLKNSKRLIESLFAIADRSIRLGNLVSDFKLGLEKGLKITEEQYLSIEKLKADYEKLFKKVDSDLNIMREILNKEWKWKQNSKFLKVMGVYTLEDVIKEYQEKHNAEIKNIMLIKSNYDETIIGVVFEKEDKK